VEPTWHLQAACAEKAAAGEKPVLYRGIALPRVAGTPISALVCPNGSNRPVGDRRSGAPRPACFEECLGKATQSHTGAKAEERMQNAECRAKPPQSLLIANRLRPQSHQKARGRSTIGKWQMAEGQVNPKPSGIRDS
jgi:hypothetical protein